MDYDMDSDMDCDIYCDKVCDMVIETNCILYRKPLYLFIYLKCEVIVDCFLFLQNDMVTAFSTSLNLKLLCSDYFLGWISKNYLKTLKQTSPSADMVRLGVQIKIKAKKRPAGAGVKIRTDVWL